MSGVSLDTSKPLTSWGLVLDGDVREGAANYDGSSVSQQRSSLCPSRLPARGLPAPSTASTCAVREGKGSRKFPSKHSTGTSLDDWERSAVDLYREIRRHRIEGPRPVHGTTKAVNIAYAERDTDAAEHSSPSQLAALMTTAFPQLLGGSFPSFELGWRKNASDSPADACPPPSFPLLLHYFLCIGYPLHPIHHAKAPHPSYGAALLTTARETVSWFGCRDAAAGGRAPSQIAAPVHCFGIHLLPDVVHQMIAMHQMKPMTATAWLLRVYVGLLAKEEANECVFQSAVMANHGFNISSPDPEMPPAICMGNIWGLANAMCTAVYQLQTGAQIAKEKQCSKADDNSFATLNGANPKTGALQQPVDSLVSERRDEDAELALFALTVLQQATTLLLSGCFNTAPADTHTAWRNISCAGAAEENPVNAVFDEDSAGTQSCSPVASAVLLPPAPTSRVVLEGLVCFTLLLRLHEKFPRLGKLQRDPKGRYAGAATASVKETAQVMVANHWHRHAQLAVQQLPHLPLHYHHFVPIIDFVLTG